MSHYIVKLVSGEFIYGKIKDVDTKMVTIDNPLMWEEFESPDGYTGSALVRYCLGTSDELIPIATTAIVSIASMSPRFKDLYEAAVSVQKMTDVSYERRLTYLTTKMQEMLLDYQAKELANLTGSIVAYPIETDSDTTYH